MKLKIGDVVLRFQKKMTVVAVGYKITCCWFDGLSLRKKKFHTLQLTKSRTSA